jgi:hypothetical protein
MFAKSEILFSQGKYDTALALCRNAALLRNPHAVINMGYYCERGYFPYQGEAERVRSAFEWYDIIALRDPVYNGSLRATALPASEIKGACDAELISTALYNIFCLLKNTDSHSVDRLLKESQSATCRKLAKQLGLAVAEQEFESANLAPPKTEGQSAQFVKRLSGGNVVFGLQTVKTEALAALCLSDGDDAKKHELSSLLLNYDFWLAPVDTQPKWESAGNAENLRKLTANYQKSGVGLLIVAYWSSGTKKIAYKKTVANGEKRAKARAYKVTLSKESFNAFLRSRLPDDAFRDFERSDIIIASERAKANNDERSRAVLQMCSK